MIVSFLLASALLGGGEPPHAGWLPIEVRISADVLLPGASGFGGVEVLGGASIGGFGLSSALAYERVVTPDAIRHGGYFLALFEVVPTAWTNPAVVRYLSVHLGAGGLVGGLQAAEARVGLVLSAGLTVPLVQDLGGKTQLALTLDYRAQLEHSPSDVPVHLLVLGIGPRWQD